MNDATTTYQLEQGQTLLLEVRRDRTLWWSLALAIAAVCIAALALTVALDARYSDPAPSSSTSSAAAVLAASHRGGPAVVRHKARQCYTFRATGKRVCTVRWVHDVRTRTTLEQFRARYGGAA